MPIFSSLARLEVPEKFLWWWVVVGFAKSFSCLTVLRCVVVGVVTKMFGFKRILDPNKFWVLK